MVGSSRNKKLLVTHASSNKCHASSNKCLTSRNKKLLEFEDEKVLILKS